MIVGLHGKMGAGKNEAAKRLALLSPDVVEVSFAAKLKGSAAALLGCSVDDLDRWKNNPDVLIGFGVVGDFHGTRWAGRFPSQTVRSFLQRYGTESHRDIFGADFWTNQGAPLDKNYDDALYVFTDTRFQNETDRLRELGGVIVGIRGPVTDTGSHASEVEVECDVWIDNTIRDDGYASLDRQLRILLNEIRLPTAA